MTTDREKQAGAHPAGQSELVERLGLRYERHFKMNHLIKGIAALLLTFSIFPVSYYTMLYGWGLSPQNMTMIVFGYAWMILIPIVCEAIKLKP